jgi:hypothetical protein
MNVKTQFRSREALRVRRRRNPSDQARSSTAGGKIMKSNHLIRIVFIAYSTGQKKVSMTLPLSVAILTCVIEG